MTYIEAIQEDLQPYPVGESLINRKCVKHGLSPLDALADESTVNLIVIEILSQMIMMNNVGEGGVSLSFNKDGVESNITRLCKEVGLDSSNYIKQSTVMRLE